MKTKPKKLIVLSALLLVLAGAFPVQIMALYGHSPLEWTAILAKLAPLNWAIIVLAPVTAWLAYRASPWLMAALPVLAVLVTYNNWLVGAMGTDYSARVALCGSLGFIAGLIALVNREGLEILLNPSARWWLTPIRRRLSLPVRFKLLSRGRSAKKSLEAFDEFHVRTFDLSETGAFIALEQASIVGDSRERGSRDGHDLQVFGTILKNLAVGTQCYLCLPLKDVSFIQCRAEIVRNTPGDRGNYPAGVGIRFLGMSRAERRKLTSYLERAQAPGVGAA